MKETKSIKQTYVDLPIWVRRLLIVGAPALFVLGAFIDPINGEVAFTLLLVYVIAVIAGLWVYSGK
jgi:hypothetical protein